MLGGIGCLWAIELLRRNDQFATNGWLLYNLKVSIKSDRWSRLADCSAHFILSFVALEKWCDKVVRTSRVHWCSWLTDAERCSQWEPRTRLLINRRTWQANWLEHAFGVLSVARLRSTQVCQLLTMQLPRISKVKWPFKSVKHRMCTQFETTKCWVVRQLIDWHKVKVSILYVSGLSASDSDVSEVTRYCDKSLFIRM